MQLPLVHLGGTSAEALADGYWTAARSISNALECLQDAAPNARDFYPLPGGDEAWKRARDEHEARVAALRAVRADMEALYEHAMDPTKKK